MSNTVTDSYDVVIIGAGPAGLTAGYLLTKTGDQKVLILEANPEYVGGISRTEKHNGYLFDIGGHRFFSKSKQIEDLWREILPNDFIERPRSSRILYDGKFYSYPLRAFEAFKNLGPIECTRCVLSYAWRRVTPVNNPRSFHEWVANQFGERLFSIFFKTYTEKVWGMSCDDISADWAAQRIKSLNLGSALVFAVRKSLGINKSATSKGSVVKTLIESFNYPRRGPGMLWEEAARKFQNQGGQLIMGSRVHHLDWNESQGQWTVHSENVGNGNHSYAARHVISTAPMRELVESVTPKPQCAALARQLGYRDFLTVAIMLNTPPGFDDNWIYIHDPTVKVGRVQNFSSWSSEMVPSADRACLGLEYFCFEGDDLWTASDESLIELAIKELVVLGLAKKENVLGGKVVRQEKAYPVYDGSYREVVDTIRKEFEERYPTLHFVGRNGMHKYNNQDHAMMTSILTVENIRAGSRRFNVWNVNEDAEYHETVSEDQAAALDSVINVPESKV